MQLRPFQLLQLNIVVTALKRAWNESSPGITGGHEEGGFILQRQNDEIYVTRWSVGIHNQISVPVHTACRIEDNDIIASFHTHPNTGDDFLQAPSLTDRRAVRDDPDLKGAQYVGEFVVADDTIYLVQPDGEVIEIAERRTLF